VTVEQGDLSEQLRGALVAELVRSGLVPSDAVRDAFATVPREIFVARLAAVRGLAEIYANEALVTQEQGGVPTSSSSQPSIMAIMLEALAVRPGDRILEVGLGTGYNAALLSTLAGPNGSVTSIDIDANLVAEATAALDRGGYPVTTVTGDGRRDHPNHGPYDRIIVTASGPGVPRSWWEQLSPDGILVAPLRIAAVQIVATFRRTGTGLRSSRLDHGGFMGLRSAGPDGQPVHDEQPVTTLRAAIPGRGLVQFFVAGPALARLSADAVVELVADLLRGRPTTTTIDPVLAWPVIWHATMTGDVEDQVGVYDVSTGPRFGYVDTRTGGLSLLGAPGSDGTVSTIETFGDDPTGPPQLLSTVDDWRRRGAPEFSRLAIDVDYEAADPPEWTVRSFGGDEHTLSLGWLPP